MRSPRFAIVAVAMAITSVVALMAIIVLFWQNIFGAEHLGKTLVAGILTWVVFALSFHEIMTRKEVRRFRLFLSADSGLQLTSRVLYGWVDTPAGEIFDFKKGFVSAPLNPEKVFKTRDKFAFERIQRLIAVS